MRRLQNLAAHFQCKSRFWIRRRDWRRSGCRRSGCWRWLDSTLLQLQHGGGECFPVNLTGLQPWQRVKLYKLCGDGVVWKHV